MSSAIRLHRRRHAQVRLLGQLGSQGLRHQHRERDERQGDRRHVGINTCYSYLSAKEAVSVTGVYKVDKEKNAIEAVAGSVAVSPDLSELEAIYAESWLKNILTEMST
jgi:hypothetical protein